LDVFDEPMIFFPIRKLVEAGVTEIVVVTGAEIDQFRTLLGDGSTLGATISYAQQDGELGIAHALLQAEPEVGQDNMVVILGDNIFQEDLSAFIKAFADQGRGARLLLKNVAIEDARRFGVATFEGSKIVKIIEKPDDPPSDLVITGCYMYDSRVFDIIRSLDPSARGELEITDVNNRYIADDEMGYDVLAGWWTDAGTPPSKLKASILVALAKGVTFHA